jgi:hypothetical protein
MPAISEIISKLFNLFIALFSPSRTFQDKDADETVINELPSYDSLYLEEELNVKNLMAYLEEAESYTIHYNRGERGKTAPLGIYYKHFPKWKGWTFLTHIAQEHEIVFDPASSDNTGCDALTEVVKQYYKDEMDALLYDFISKEYYERLNLDLFPGKKSALSYFSITVNAGKRRSAKLLQKVLVANGAKIKIDGKAGPKTYRALVESGLDDAYLNQQLLLQVYYFYNYLVGRNPKKYSRFYDGWVNRLKRLGFVVPV